MDASIERRPTRPPHMPGEVNDIPRARTGHGHVAAPCHGSASAAASAGPIQGSSGSWPCSSLLHARPPEFSSLSLTTMRLPEFLGRARKTPNGPIGKAASRPCCNGQLGSGTRPCCRKLRGGELRLCVQCLFLPGRTTTRSDSDHRLPAMDAIRHACYAPSDSSHHPPCAGCDSAMRAWSVNPATRTMLNIQRPRISGIDGKALILKRKM